MDASLISKTHAGQAAAAHVVGTALSPKNGVTSNARSPFAARAANSAATGSATGSSSSTSTTASSASTAGSTITANDFLTLLVSELKNQDPTQPTDPNQYITQLTQVNSLEQLISINSGIAALDSSVSASASGTGSGRSAVGQAVPAPASANAARTTVGINLT